MAHEILVQRDLSVTVHLYFVLFTGDIKPGVRLDCLQQKQWQAEVRGLCRKSIISLQLCKTDTVEIRAAKRYRASHLKL